MVNKPFLFLVAITESLFLIVMHIFLLVWRPRLQETKQSPELNEVFTLFMFSLTAGGTLFKVS